VTNVTRPGTATQIVKRGNAAAALSRGVKADSEAPGHGVVELPAPRTRWLVKSLSAEISLENALNHTYNNRSLTVAAR
jgi:hypothetical protein